MILITGATGNVGSEVLRRLLDSHEPLRVLVRDPSRLPPTAKQAEFVQGNLNHRSSVRAALRSVDKVFLVAPGPDVPAQEKLVIQEAEQAGISRLVQVSSLGAEGGYGGGPAHLPGEQYLRSTRLAWTILRPSAFMSNILFAMGSILREGTYYDPTWNQPYPYIDPRDVGSVAAEVLRSEGHEAKIYELTGGRAISASDQLRTLSGILNRTIRRIDLPLPEFRREKDADPIGRFYDLVRSGQLKSVLPTVQNLLRRTPNTFEQWASAHAQILAAPWNA